MAFKQRDLAEAAAVPAASCSICMSEDLPEPARIKGCSHTFCPDCIRQWCQRTARCPLCNCSVETLLLANGEEEAVKAPGPSPDSNEAPDLDCLDHGYMLSDINRVLSRARGFQDALMRDAYGCGRGGNGDARHAEATLAALGGVIGRLLDYKSAMEHEVRYDPQLVLADMYRLNDTLSNLQSTFRRGLLKCLHWLHQLPLSPTGGERFHELRVAPAPSTSAATAACAADAALAEQEPSDAYYEEDYDYYDDDGDDSCDGGLQYSKTPGRRPSHRNARTVARTRR